MNREELRLKYADEKVLCIRNSNIERNTIMNYLDLAKYYGFFDYRYNAELNYEAKQLIPYIVIKHEDKIFTSTRIKGDERLVGKMSIGMGGHIDSEDASYITTKDGALIDSVMTIGVCIKRELEEETTFNNEMMNSMELVDSFIDLSTDVSKVHMCLLYVLNLNTDKLDIREVDKLVGDFKDVTELFENYDKLENWSQKALDILYPNKIVPIKTDNKPVRSKVKKVSVE